MLTDSPTPPLGPDGHLPFLRHEFPQRLLRLPLLLLPKQPRVEREECVWLLSTRLLGVEVGCGQGRK